MDLLKQYIQSSDLQKLKELASTSSVSFYLLKEGDFDFPLNESSLMFALGDGITVNFDIIKFLVDEVGVNINKCNNFGISPIVQSTLHENISITEFLLSRKANTYEYLPLSDDRNLVGWLEKDCSVAFKEQAIQAMMKYSTSKIGGGKRFCIRN